MKVGLAFVSEQIFNNLFRGGVRSDESLSFGTFATLNINIVVSLLPSNPLRLIFLIVHCPEDLIH